MTTDAAPTGPQVTYIHTDGLGSPVARTDEKGNVISRTRYEPYGATAGGATPTIGFTGHVNDADTSLTYMQQRYYDPIAGRFMSVDPVLTDANTGSSFNRYIYGNNNPFKYVDPDGRDIIVVVNNNFPIIGGHVGIIVRNPGSNLVYDPGGSYKQNEGKGSSDTIDGKIKDYVDFQKVDGPDVLTFTFITSKEIDQKITDKIDFDSYLEYAPDGREVVILSTPCNDICLMFTRQELANFSNVINEAIYMQSIYKLVHE